MTYCLDVGLINRGHPMERIAWISVVVGTLILLVYAVYYSFNELFNNAGVPAPVKIAVPILLCGVVALALVIVKERIAGLRKENFRRDDK